MFLLKLIFTVKRKCVKRPIKKIQILILLRYQSITGDVPIIHVGVEEIKTKTCGLLNVKIQVGCFMGAHSFSGFPFSLLKGDLPLFEGFPLSVLKLKGDRCPF